jgi:hypothetical protein
MNVSGLTLSTTLTGTSQANFGEILGGGADINGDGYSDVIVGMGGTTAYVYLGGASSVSSTTAATYTASGECASVALAGDLNGDGFAEALCGDDVANQVLVFPGSTTPPALATTPVRTLTGPSSSGYALDLY